MRASCLHNRRIWNYEIKKWIFIADDVREGWWIELGVRLWVMSREVALHCALSFMSDFIECSLCWRSLFIFQSVTQLINLRPFQLPLSSPSHAKPFSSINHMNIDTICLTHDDCNILSILLPSWFDWISASIDFNAHRIKKGFLWPFYCDENIYFSWFEILWRFISVSVENNISYSNEMDVGVLLKNHRLGYRHCRVFMSNNGKLISIICFLIAFEVILMHVPQQKHSSQAIHRQLLSLTTLEIAFSRKRFKESLECASCNKNAMLQWEENDP